jgi:hypothetical protein
MPKQKDHPLTIKKKFTRKILNSLKKSKERRIREGEVYCIDYRNDKFPTDKWHQLSIVFIVEIWQNEIEAYNLLYLPDDTAKKILESAIELKSLRDSYLRVLIRSELSQTPWVYARKVFQPAKIEKFTLIEKKEWNQLIGLNKSLFGNLNDQRLMEAWKEENKPRKIEEDKKEKEIKEKIGGNTFTVEEDLDVKEVVFDEKPNENLNMLTSEIIDFDDDDI